MNKEQALQSFGLTEAEVSLYISLLKTEESTASALAKTTNTNRTFTYDRLKKLHELGLVSYIIKDNKKYFKAADPSQLLAILKEKEEQIQTILPELEKLKTEHKPGPEVEIFSSKKGIRTALNLILREKREVLIHGSMNKFHETMESFYEIWNKRRQKENILAKVLTNEEADLPLAETDLLTEEEKTSTTTFTFGNKTIIVWWSDLPTAILIESDEIARDNTAIFNNIWEREIKIYSNIEGMQHAWMELVNQPSSELIGFGFSWHLAQIYGKDFSDEWHKRRINSNLPTRLISYNDNDSRRYFSKRRAVWQNFNIQFLNEDMCGPACIVLSDHLLVTFIYTEEKIKVIVNKNKEAINAYRKYFETLWEKSI